MSSTPTGVGMMNTRKSGTISFQFIVFRLNRSGRPRENDILLTSPFPKTRFFHSNSNRHNASPSPEFRDKNEEHVPDDPNETGAVQDTGPDTWIRHDTRFETITICDRAVFTATRFLQRRSDEVRQHTISAFRSPGFIHGSGCLLPHNSRLLAPDKWLKPTPAI